MNIALVPFERPFELDFLKDGGEMGALIRDIDWSQTPLGPARQWSPSLRMMVSFLLANRFPLLLWWGPRYVQIYNDAYRPVLGTKHPRSLGQPASECWTEIWSIIGPLIDKPFEGGAATWMDDLELEINRHGFFEESHFTVAYSPVPDETAERRIGGVLATVHEITQKVIGERRVAILSELGARLAQSRTAEEACETAGETFRNYAKDIPFAILYLRAERADRSNRVLRHVCEVGIPTGFHSAATVDCSDPDANTPWPLALALARETPQVVENLGDLLPVRPRGPWSDPPDKAVVLPIKSNVAHEPAGALVLGVSSRIALDSQYLTFFDLVTSQIATAVANARAYEEEKRRAEALAEIDRAKTVFFSNVSHEFRTPLTLMLGPIEDLLKDPAVPGQAREQLGVTHRNALRLLKLVNSLLDFSRIEAGRIQAAYEPTDLAQLTRDLASTFRSAMERAGLAYTVECAALEEAVYVDREMWEKIVLNLLSNAFKFTPTGAVNVRLSRENEHAILQITDTGVGIPPAELPRVFERFHRVEGTHGRTYEGSGIGLALVQELVRLHSGLIEAASEPGTGTRFTVRVPFGSAHLPPEQVHPPTRGSRAALAQAFVQEALRWLPDDRRPSSSFVTSRPESAVGTWDQRFASTFGSRIILADDNADMRAYVQDLLAPCYRVETVSDGEAALRAAEREPPDLLLSDVMMPRLDGFGVLRAIRGNERLRNVPVVLLSARAGEESRIEGLDAGADDYLIKPFSSRELLARIGALLELRQMRRAAEDNLRRRSEQFQTLLTAAPLGVYVVDADLRIQEANPTAVEFFGYAPGLLGHPQGLLGRPLHDLAHSLWPAEYADSLIRLFRETLRTGEQHVSRESAQPRRDRIGLVYYDWQINRIPLPDGRHGVVCYFRDISEHVQARVRLEAINRHQNEFLAMLAHELRNPLAPISNAVHLLTKTRGVIPDLQQVPGILQRQVTHLTRLVDDLLDVSRVTQGRIELKPRTMPLGTLISQAVESVDPLFKAKQQQVSVVTHANPTLYVDPERLVQCIVNLLTNAAKYTESQGEIHIESAAGEDEVIVRVTDTGAGIPADLLPRVFDLFVQSDRTLDRSQGGLGIGLCVVKRLVEMHGGRVCASSPGPGRGSTFEIRLPLTSEMP
jgi:PAS domain S-box-containing protein